MPEALVLNVRFQDPELFYSTLVEYSLQVKLGELRVEEAQDNLAALAIGMMKIEEHRQ